ncbi:Activator of osmoprotectant transporter ProP [Variovorax sp. HW608]|uniref:ProQ/FINO family protein n=1 Tax=Variovorax sp. HW608 TaxID=1034889 RepID=UPI00081FFC7B|nr:ProQ/FINO family protein [Variovorax sp. HW608]SCK61555.1 Activator of osmoprotectant transporter ProP [Variovorax sp. HW608]
MTSTNDNDAAAPAAPEAPAAPAAPRRRGRRGGSQNARPAEAKANQQPAQQATQKAQKGQKGQQKPARKVHPVLQRLFELYPKMFGARFLPLKLGAYQDLLAAHPDEFKKEDLKIALGLHARSTRYLEAVAAGEHRHDLNGVPVEPVAPEHVHHAILEVFKRRQARTGEDLRPKLRERLVAAIEASGLTRDEYVLAMRGGDETSNAVLGEAFAEVGARTAKREALRRAFEASGKSVAEFAEMYGMQPEEVERTLQSARPRAGV